MHIYENDNSKKKKAEEKNRSTEGKHEEGNNKKYFNNYIIFTKYIWANAIVSTLFMDVCQNRHGSGEVDRMQMKKTNKHT